MSVEDIELDTWEPSRRLSRDLRDAAALLGDAEARFLVDAYYIHQENRKRSSSQERTLDEGGEPSGVIEWVVDHSNNIEGQIKLALDSYTRAHVMGSWMREIHGIGPVLSAGLLAHIYMGEWCAVCHGHNITDCLRRQMDRKRKLRQHAYVAEVSCPTVGHIWQFAGIAGDGQRPWKAKTKRPYNAKLKTLCWKVGQSFMKQSTHPQCYYGHVYRERKAIEVAKNEAGDFAQQAANALATKNFDKSTDAYKAYAGGRLPPAHIDARARRYAVKLFLSHLHGEWYRKQFGTEPPLPYPIAILGHAHQR